MQKGTIGILLSANDMPFTQNGMKPDLIVNPHGFPGRMTAGQLLEIIIGKISCNKGMLGDGTAFEHYNTYEIGDELEKIGFQRNGKEKLINGITGDEILTDIFIGPCFYQRLKHLTEDKIHARARGPTTLLTHQPTEGRSRDGGLRVGEMERDTFISYGLSKFLQEKMMNNADSYVTQVCGECGVYARRYIDDFKHSDLQSYPTPTDVYYCPTCNNSKNINQIRIPYAFKLFTQELMAMNIVPRIFCKNE